MLKFSVITPSFNQGRYIEQAITSVLAQDYPCFEHIIIDGGSNDQTLSILKRYGHLQWVSEEDRGQSDALNKGFRWATGDVIAWINSDDWYEPGAFAVVADFFMRNCDEKVVMGDCNLVMANGRVFDRIINVTRGFDELLAFWRIPGIPTQPAVFFKKELIDRHGLLDEALFYAMDYDLWLRFARECSFCHINQTVANYRFHPEAKGGDQDWRKFIPEQKMVSERYGGRSVELPSGYVNSLRPPFRFDQLGHKVKGVMYRFLPLLRGRKRHSPESG